MSSNVLSNSKQIDRARKHSSYAIVIAQMTKFKQVKLVRFIDEESPLRAVGFSNNGFGKCVLVETSDGGDPVPKPAMRLSNKDLWEKWTS